MVWSPPAPEEKCLAALFFFSPAKIPTSYVHFGNKRSTLLQQNGWNWPSWSLSSLTRLYSHISVWDNKIFCTHSLFHLLVFFFNHEELPVPSFVINRTTLSSKELAVSGFFFIYILLVFSFPLASCWPRKPNLPLHRSRHEPNFVWLLFGAWDGCIQRVYHSLY